MGATYPGPTGWWPTGSKLHHTLLHAQLTNNNPQGLRVISIIELTVYFHYTVYKTVISSHDYTGILVEIIQLIFYVQTTRVLPLNHGKIHNENMVLVAAIELFYPIVVVPERIMH